MSAADSRVAAPTYRHVFERDELDAIKACHDEHGFAIVKDVLSLREVDELKADIEAYVNPNRDLPPGQTRFAMVFIEQSPAMLRLLDNKALMSIARKVIGSDELVVNRSAAIVKNPGAKAEGWHTDFDTASAPGTSLNSGEWPN